MVKKEVPRLRNHQPVIQVTKKAHAPPMQPLRNRSEDSGEDLWSCGQTKAQHLELVDTTLEAKASIQARLLMDWDLEISILEIYREYPLGRLMVTKLFSDKRSMTGLHPPVIFSTRKRQL